MKVFVDNFGQGNSLWPLAKANSILATLHDVWTCNGFARVTDIIMLL